MKRHLVIFSLFLASCLATGGTGPQEDRVIRNVRVAFDQTIVVRSSVLEFEFEGTENRQASFGVVHFIGSAGDGGIDTDYVVPVDRVGDDGNLVVRVRVIDGLWDLVNPETRTTFSGLINLELHDEIGLFAEGDLSSVKLVFEPVLLPEIETIDSGLNVFPNELLRVSGEGVLRPEEGTTWVVVDSGNIVYEDGSQLPIRNARTPLTWVGDRNTADFRIHPSLFGVRNGTFQGDIRFENELKTGESFLGNKQGFSCNLQRPSVSDISPDAGSRGQKVTISGRGFLAPEAQSEIGTYLVFEGTFTPDNVAIPPVVVEGANAFVRVPFRVIDEKTIEQDVWYDVDPDTRQLTGLGATPGRFEGTVQPVIFNGADEQEGVQAPVTFNVLPTKQIIYIKYLPGFTRALEQYGLQRVETEIKGRIQFVLSRDYDGVNIEIREEEPTDFVEFTTIEIGGTDPSGLLNFGYDNSFNDGGKDIGNLYLSDYLGGVNRHSQDAGYLPFGGVFIESFIAFSPTLYPDNFGTSQEFDLNLSPFMVGLGGEPVSEDEWPHGPRDAAIRNAIDLIGNLTGHTASHEIGHSLGLAHFPPTVEGFEERFHNDPPGPNWIMDAGADRPFEERAELNGKGPAVFSTDQRRYLENVLPR